MKVVLYTIPYPIPGDIKNSYLRRLMKKSKEEFDLLLPWETNEFVNLRFGTNPHKIICKYFRSPQKHILLQQLEGHKGSFTP